MNSKKIGNIFKGDIAIWMVFFFLCMTSILEVFSASSSLTYKSGDYMAPVIKHIFILCFGVCTIICMLKIKCKYFKLATPVVLLTAFLLLLAVLATGQSTNGASRWFNIAGTQFQPSELAKGAVVLGVAQILSAMQTEHGADKKAFKFICILSVFFIVPIGLENLSTAALLCITIFCMMILGRVPGKQLGGLLGVALIGVILVVTTVFLVGHDKNESPNPDSSLTEQVDTPKEKPGFLDKMFHRADTWKSRINKFGKEDVAPEDVDLDKDAQVAHANIAIASSNIIGKLPGNSVERDFLSQAFSDFIYAIIIEEMGIFGAFYVAFLYIVLLWRAGIIASRCENNFPAFLCMGLAILLVTQALFNMAVAVGLAPVTGQPLPLISRGGTSTLINCVYIGMILSISRTAKKKEAQNNSRAFAKTTSA